MYRGRGNSKRGRKNCYEFYKRDDRYREPERKRSRYSSFHYGQSESREYDHRQQPYEINRHEHYKYNHHYGSQSNVSYNESRSYPNLPNRLGNYPERVSGNVSTNKFSDSIQKRQETNGSTFANVETPLKSSREARSSSPNADKRLANLDHQGTATKPKKALGGTQKTKMKFKKKAITRKKMLGGIKLKKALLNMDVIEDDVKSSPIPKNAANVFKPKISSLKPIKHDSTDLDLYLRNLKAKKDKELGGHEIFSDDEDGDVRETDTLPYEYDQVQHDSKKKDKQKLPVFPQSKREMVKSLYEESSFISNMTDEEVSSLRIQNAIVIHGNNPVRSILTWAQSGFSSNIYEVLMNLKFGSPTPIQGEALPNIMSGRDFIGIAKTGSGKTLAYLLPMFRHILANVGLMKRSKTSNSVRHSASQPLALILTPTRELATQVFKVCQPFLSSLHIHGQCCYGGQSISHQISGLKIQADVIVATPGRLIDLLGANNGKILSLSDISYFVLDEADRMFDMGFEPQVEKVAGLMMKHRQTVLFSATFPPKVERLALRFLNDPIRVSVGIRNLLSKDIDQKFLVLDPDDKFPELLRILGEFKAKDANGKVLVFADTQNSCDRLVQWLSKRGYPSLSLHGGLDQSDRDEIITDFRNGVIDILVATSVASRGLDIDNLNMVINFYAPSHMEDYIHRVGRTGRAGRKGKSYTMITHTEEKAASDIVKLLELSSMPVPTDLQNMSTSFREKVKAGKARFSGGFGGKGLEKLEELREEKRKQQEQIYDNNDKVNEDKVNDKQHEKSNDKVAGNENKKTPEGESLPANFFAEPAAPGAVPFHAKIEINDLSPRVRWSVANANTLKKVIDQTSVAITNKGQFYPPGKIPKADDTPKLYLLVEGSDELKVKQAMGLFNEAYTESLNAERGRH